MFILILGSTGALGTALKFICEKKKIDYLGLSHEDIEITDKNKLEELIEKYKPSIIINCVALIGINLCEEQPEKSFLVNSIAVSHLAKLCEKNEITLIQPSSHAVFDGNKSGFYTEKDIPNPTNVYGISKFAGELFALNLCPKHYIFRFPTMFGPRNNTSPGFVDKIVLRLEQGQDARIADDKIDSPTYTLDVAEKIIEIIKANLPYGVYHIANQGSVSYYDFIFALAKLIGKENLIKRAKESDFPSLAPKPLKTSLASIKLSPMRCWEEALKEYVDNYITP
jgi:dTDP-4-dehydrorhamnose reductase